MEKREPDAGKKYKIAWTAATAFTGLTLGLMLVWLIVAGIYLKLYQNAPFRYSSILCASWEFFFNPVTLIIVLILSVWLFYVSKQYGKNIDGAIAILFSLPICILNYLFSYSNLVEAKRHIKGFFYSVLSDTKIDPDFTDSDKFSSYLLNNYVFELFKILIVSSIVLLIMFTINLFILQNISPYKKKLNEKETSKDSPDYGSFIYRFRRFFAGNYYIFYVILFNILFHLTIIQFLKESGVAWTMQLLILSIIPTYSGFVTGFSQKNIGVARFFGMIAGGVFSIIQSLMILRSDIYNDEILAQIYFEWPVILILLILGCFISREMGIKGYNLKQKIKYRNGRKYISIQLLS